MKTLRIVFGALSIAFFVIMLFMSCGHSLLGVSSVISEEKWDTGTSMGEVGTDEFGQSAGAYILSAIIFLISGIVALAGKNSKAATIVSAVFYIVAGIACFLGKTPDIYFFAYMGFIFAGFALVSVFVDKSLKKSTDKVDN